MLSLTVKVKLNRFNKSLERGAVSRIAATFPFLFLHFLWVFLNFGASEIKLGIFSCYYIFNKCF